MSCVKIFLRSMLIISLFATGCASSDADSSDAFNPGITWDAVSAQTVVNLENSDEQKYYISCTDFVRFYQQEGTKRVRLDYAGLKSLKETRDGYFVDESLILPPIDECDIVSCESFNGFERKYEMKKYEYTGDRLLTDQEKTEYQTRLTQLGDTSAVPEKLPEYVSSEVHGAVEVEIDYFDQSQCSFTPKEIPANTYLDSFIIP
ncbi:MAG: hypothetical protein JXR76_31700 [Deltaproteobacteria bacterium]|nr:hypothetical protein [Deltaproteobacteria bacterium]